MPGVTRNYTAHLFSIQAKCYLGMWRKHAGHTAMPQQPLCVVRVAVAAKSAFEFLIHAKRTVSRVAHGVVVLICG
jgi:hypothetical protein